MLHPEKLLPSMLALMLLTPLIGCEDADDVAGEVESVSLADDSFDVPVANRDRSRPLPAWQTDEERQAAKDDSFDVRGTYQDIYGITAAPAGPVRAVAEFERTDGVLIAWDEWLVDYMVQLVDAVAREATAYIITDSLNQSRDVQRILARNGVNTGNVRFFEFQNDSFWTRDFGPITVARADGSTAMIGAEYFPDRRRDDAIPTLMGRYFGIETYRPPLATEGGNFMSNGVGLCAVTDSVLEQNPQLSRQDVLTIKRDYFGCAETLIVESMEGEGTGHIDMFAKFVSEDTVLVGQYNPRDDRWNAAILDRNAERFSRIVLPDGRPMRVVRIPMPRPTYPIYRSYTNSTIVNGTVIVPIYRADRQYETAALNAYRQAMPGYRIVTIDSEDPIELGGAVHCTTMGFTLGNLRAANDDVERPEPVIDEPTVGSNAYESTPNAPIRDLQQTVDRLVIGESGLIRGMTLELEIDHSYVGDLFIYLERNGEQLVLHRQAGGGAQNLYRAWAIDAWNGTDRRGEWTLVIEDRARQDEGVLRRWSLSFD
jgi:agmatine deiminase